MELTIYINPECSKCQGACGILDTMGMPVKKIAYLTAIPSRNELKGLLEKLGMKAEQLVRKSEKLYLEKFSNGSFSEEEWVRILHENPVLIERPIVVMGDKAIVARPPEKLLELFV